MWCVVGQCDGHSSCHPVTTTGEQWHREDRVYKWNDKTGMLGEYIDICKYFWLHVKKCTSSCIYGSVTGIILLAYYIYKLVGNVFQLFLLSVISYLYYYCHLVVILQRCSVMLLL